MECGLLGRKLGHSYSPQIHACLGDYSYTLFEKEPEEVADFLKNGDFTGLNVTIPYKKSVIPCLDELSPTAKKLGAVNTVVQRGRHPFRPQHGLFWLCFPFEAKRSGCRRKEGFGAGQRRGFQYRHCCFDWAGC